LRQLDKADNMCVVLKDMSSMACLQSVLTDRG